MFITLEGIEGTGKTTLMNHLVEAFQSRGQEIVATREPGGCVLGKTLRAILLNPDTKISPEAELFLFLADRAQHVTDVIRPALQREAVVLCDRYADSTIVYQGYGRQFDIEQLRRLNHIAIGGLWPDRTFVLDMEPEAALRRALARNRIQGLDTTEGRFEAESLAFHTRLRNGFLLWAERNPTRMTVLDASLTPEELTDEVLHSLFR